MAQVGGTCYPDDASALQAVAAREAGAIREAGAVVYVIDAVPAVGGITVTMTPVGGGSAVVSSVPVTLQPCNLLDWPDALELGWGVAAAWIVTAVVLHLRQAAHA
jgi:hypothetical protein